MVKQILPYIFGAVIGFLVTWIIKPTPEINTEPYELKAEIQELKHAAEIQAIKNKYATSYTKFADSDPEYRDSVLLSFGF